MFDEDLRVSQREEDLAVQTLVPQFSIEAFAMAVFPGAAGPDVERFHVEFAEPIPYSLSNEFRSIVRANMLRLPAIGGVQTNG